MTEANVYIIFTEQPSEEQIAELKDTCEKLGLTLQIGAPRPRP
jgi:hypothetical protein